MAKGKTATVFFCQNCGYESTKWLGQCPGCREWNTFVEETIDKTVLKNTGAEESAERLPNPVYYLKSRSVRRTRHSPGSKNWTGCSVAESYRVP